MFDKLFSWTQKKAKPQPAVVLGRYSDNNKTVQKNSRWEEADSLFNSGNYVKSLDAFFDYLRDDAINNVITERKGEVLNFTLYQGSKVVRGRCDQKGLTAEVNLVRMPQASIPVMRKLLEHNSNLFYSRYSMQDDRICMRFDSEIETSSPTKLYYGLKELATKADTQDDILVQDFIQIEEIDTDHISSLPEAERKVKVEYLRRLINDTLGFIDTLDKDRLAGGIGYMLLGLAYRLDYLIAPEGKLLSELEEVIGRYFNNPEKQPQEKNALMAEGFKKILEKSDEDLRPYLFKSTATFSIVSPPSQKAISEAIETAMQNMIWYRDNKYNEIARQIMEYGISYCQYSYSLPQPLTLLFNLFMEINYPDYYHSLGFQGLLFDVASNQFEKDEIEERVNTIIAAWIGKHTKMTWKHQNIRYDHILSFNQSFLTEIQGLNFDDNN